MITIKKLKNSCRDNKRALLLLLPVIALLCVLCGCKEGKAAFEYQHDPRMNPSAMADIIENPDAVESYRQERLKYHQSLESLYEILDKMNSEHKSVEEMARAVSAERNRLRLAACEDDPEALAKVKESNLNTYGYEDGPRADDLYEKYGSWEIVLQKAFGTNSGMDACCGLYDDYYTLYVELGHIEK